MEQNEEKLSISIFCLRALAGYVNATAILELGRVVSAHTGNSTKFALALVEGDMQNLLSIIMATACFLVGTIVSGFFYPSNELKSHRNYGNVIMLIGLGYLLFGWLGSDTLYFLMYLSFALGLQNGMHVYYKGLIVRTTILSGTITDIGVEMGKQLRGLPVEEWKLKFFTCNFLFFVIGAIIAAFLARYTNFNLMLVAGLLAVCIGSYFTYTQKEIMETEEGLL
ncbi:YoaK family protein [Jeotgalibaca sp. A122]|uniref:YoaK family protein n=1 Tax=Jeotgalibaca sp. A122 TaxID=3457322 RepID=UPI003FD5813A